MKAAGAGETKSLVAWLRLYRSIHPIGPQIDRRKLDPFRYSVYWSPATNTPTPSSVPLDAHLHSSLYPLLCCSTISYIDSLPIACICASDGTCGVVTSEGAARRAQSHRHPFEEVEAHYSVPSIALSAPVIFKRRHDHLSIADLRSFHLVTSASRRPSAW